MLWIYKGLVAFAVAVMVQSSAIAQTNRQLPSSVEIEQAINICTLQYQKEITGRTEVDIKLRELFSGILDFVVDVVAKNKSGADIQLNQESLQY